MNDKEVDLDECIADGSGTPTCAVASWRLPTRESEDAAPADWLRLQQDEMAR